MQATGHDSTIKNLEGYSTISQKTPHTRLKGVLMDILITGLILIFIASMGANANIGYNELNLIDHKTNNFIHANSTIPLTNYTFEFITGINWISIPFNSTINTAHELIIAIENNGTSQFVCDQVVSYDAIIQNKKTYYKRRPGRYAGDNFEIKPNSGYEILVSENTEWTVTCLQPTKPTLQYQIFNLNKYYGTNIIRPRRSLQHD